MSEHKFGKQIKASDAPLETFHISASSEGLQSNTSLIVGVKEAIMIDPPFLVPDANRVIEWTKGILGEKKLIAIFVTHHHPDHYMSATPILEVFKDASFFAAPYVRAGIDREYDDKVDFWPKVYGDRVPKTPRRPDVYPYSFITLADNGSSPICMLGPVQGDSIDHTLFWLPAERVVITGDIIYGRSVHAWVEELETKELVSAWLSTLDLIDALKPVKVICGHTSQESSLDAKADLAHTRKYLELFMDKITFAPKKPEVKEIYSTFENAFPQCTENKDFFLGMLSNTHGEGGKVWEENRHHNVTARTTDSLEGYILGKHDI